MSSQLIETEHNDGILAITLNRPPANALTPDFLFEIEKCILAQQNNPLVKAVIITGQNNTLSAGMDLKLLPSLDAQGQRETVDALNRAYYALYNFPKPLIAAVNGHAIAGGLFFVLASDYRIGTIGNAQFGLTEVRVGVSFPVAPLEIARTELPKEAFRQMLLGGKVFGVEKAKAWGILDEVINPDEIFERALEIAREYAASPEDTFATIKRQVRLNALMQMEHAISELNDPVRNSWFSAQTATTAKSVLEGSRA